MMIPDSEKEGFAQEIKYPPMVSIIYHRGVFVKCLLQAFPKRHIFTKTGNTVF